MAAQLRQKVKVYPIGELEDGRYARLGPIDATSCRNQAWESSSEEDAVNQLLYKSSRMGGTGVTDVICESEGTNLAKNCWSSVTCYGSAIKLAPSASRPQTVAAATPIAPATKREPSTGTGFVVSSEGHILTNSHVVHGAKSITVSFGGERMVATIVREDLQNDLAVLKTERTATKPLRFRDDSRVRAGESALAMGFPLSGLLSKEAHVTTGTVTALAGLQDDVRFLQISAPLQPGNSGGPVLDESGRVIGVAVAKLDALKMAIATGDIPQNVNFAIKSSLAKTFLEAAGIGFGTSGNAERQRPAELADQARAAVVFVECE